MVREEPGATVPRRRAIAHLRLLRATCKGDANPAAFGSAIMARKLATGSMSAGRWRMIGAADVVVIGAGAFGASVAFHLARLGNVRVALVERHAVASQTSPRAAGLTSKARGSDLMMRLADLAVRKIERFADETGEPLVYHQTGALKIARLPEHVEQLQREVARARETGVDLDFISPAEAQRRHPFLRDSGILAMIYSPGDLYLEPAQLPLGYARAAQRLGAEIVEQTAVTAIATRDGAVTGVVTDQGEIRTPVVVDAGGAWTRVVGRMIGANIQLVPTRHQLMISEPIAGVEPDQPIARVIDVNVYIRPEQGGLMLGGYEADPLQFDAQSLAPGFQIADLPLDIGVLRRLADSVTEQFPVLRDFRVREHRGGLPTMTPDGRHIVGPVPGVRGFFVASGCCVGGLSIAPAVGDVLADWIVNDAPPMDLAPLSPGRFGPAGLPEHRLRGDCLWHYAHHYSAER
jgi:glycine/D-amino acid oxidase-like deaminating enzyme